LCLALGRFLEALLFQDHPHDPLTIVLASCTALIISSLTLYLPLRRATHVDCTPIITLRNTIAPIFWSSTRMAAEAEFTLTAFET